MKSMIVLVLSLISSIMVSAMTPQRPIQAISLEGRLNYPFISDKGGSAYLQLHVTTAAITVAKERKPMNLAIVLDRSGSMGDQQKFDYAKKAFSSLIDQLMPDDILSVVVYDDAIDVLRTARTVGRDKSSVKRLLDEVYPRGSTNLGGGLMEGLRQAQRNAGREYINRVVLLSDGLANVGLTDPRDLNRITAQYRRQPISVTTMGVGLDYNENLMISLAESGGGNYYFIEHARSLAAIVHKEFNMISSVLAQNASIHITLGNGVTVNDIIGCDYTTNRNTYIIPVGDLYANDQKDFTIQLLIPAGKGSMTVASGEIRYESDKVSNEYPSFSTSVKFTHDVAVIENNRDLTAQAKADIAVSTKKIDQAMEALDTGDKGEAERRLHEAKEMIGSSPAASASGAGGEAVRSQLGRIDAFQKSVKDEDVRKAKKSIQYENYQTKKNK